MKRLSGEVQTALAATTGVAEESISSVQFVKTYANEEKEFAKYGAKIQHSYSLGRRMAVAFGAFQGFAEFASYARCVLMINCCSWLTTCVAALSC